MRPEADRAHDADLLAPLDDRPRADHAERRDPDEEPEPMKPWISRLNVMLAAIVSSTTSWIDCASRPFARNADRGSPRRPRRRRRARGRSSGSSGSSARERRRDGLLRRGGCRPSPSGRCPSGPRRPPGARCGRSACRRPRAGSGRTALLVEEARDLEVGRGSKFQESRRGTTKLSTTARPGRLRTASHTSRSTYPRRLAEAEGRVREERVVEAADEVRLLRTAGSSCFACTASTDWLPTTG